MSKTLVETKFDDGLAVVLINNPPNNLLDNKLLDLIEKECALVERNGARAILFLSKLKHFSAGANPEFLNHRKASSDTMRLIKIIEGIGIPTVAGINGTAVGGGFELALGCDFIVASETSSIGLVEVSVGLMPLAGGVQRVIERAGVLRGKEMSMLGRRYDAETLEKWGVINLVVPEIQLSDAAVALAKQLANGPTVALREIKRISRIALGYGVKRADDEMKRSSEVVLNSSDARVGIEFLSRNSDQISFDGK